MREPERLPLSESGSLTGRLLVCAALAVPLAGGPFQEVRADCREVAKPLQEALAARDLDAARRHYDAVENEVGCDSAYRRKAKRALSNLHAQVAQERLAGGASLASQRALLERGRAYAGTWLTLYMLGNVAHDAREYDRAAALYQEALVAINNKTATPEPLPDSVIDRIHRLAGQDRLLAGRHVETPTNRAGEPDGLAAPGYRGFKPKAELVPITFKTGLSEFDALGRRYADDMAQAMKAQALKAQALEQNPARIVLSAHTDERGGDAYNLELSRQRGEALRDFLQGQGVKQPIEVIAKGEREPLDLFDPEHYGQEEVWRMNRRVEWVR